MGYGVEIWGWKEREEMERIEERFLKWVLGVNGETPGYMVREELQRDKVRGRAGRRVWGYEERLREGKGSELARKCWEEIRMRGREGKTGSSWEREREKYFRDRGYELREVERRREEGEGRSEEIEKWEKEMQRKERLEIQVITNGMGK